MGARSRSPLVLEGRSHPAAPTTATAAISAVLGEPAARAAAHAEPRPRGRALPPNARPIRQAKDNDIVYFQLSGPSPAREGDGWLVAGQLGEPAAALLILPGERPSYGGQDLRSPTSAGSSGARPTTGSASARSARRAPASRSS